MKITLLGTGDAVGTPRIGCSCPQCIRANIENISRLRTSVLIEADGRNILIDTSPDLRQQLLANGSPHIDAVIWTHGHYDHFMGFGEFYRVQEIPPVFAAPPVLSYGAGIFGFLTFKKNPINPYEPFDLFGCSITPFLVRHPPAYTCGMLIEADGVKIGFTSDTNADIPTKSLGLLKNLDLLLLDALVPPEIHIPKHMNYFDACLLAKNLTPTQFRCVHASHLLSWDLPSVGRDGESFVY